MRILFVVNALVYGGAETQLIALAVELCRRGHDVVIYTLQGNNPRAGELDGTGVRVIEGRKRFKFDPLLIAEIHQYIVAFRPHIVQGFLVDGNLHARLAAIGTGVPALNSERSDNYVWPLPHRIAARLTRWLAAGLVANSHSGARLAQRYLGLSDDHVHVVWNGIDVRRVEQRASASLNLRREFFESDDVKVACLVGMIRPEKDYLLALDVARALSALDSSWRVLLVGDALPQTSDYKAMVMDAARPLARKRLVDFTGLRDDVPAVIRGVDVLFSTSVREGFPNVVLEAMAVGTPVVSTDVSDIRMILPNGWQVAGRDAHALAAAIVRAHAERAAVVEQQRAWLMANATISMAAERLERVYRGYAARLQPLTTEVTWT